MTHTYRSLMVFLFVILFSGIAGLARAADEPNKGMMPSNGMMPNNHPEGMMPNNLSVTPAPNNPNSIIVVPTPGLGGVNEFLPNTWGVNRLIVPNTFGPNNGLFVPNNWDFNRMIIPNTFGLNGLFPNTWNWRF